MSFSINIGPNIRKSPFFDATVADGVRSFSVYNHMYIPGHYGDPEAEYQRLINGVAMWDVGAQRQVQIEGPDAGALMQYLTTRDVSDSRPGHGRYVPLCNFKGELINDPVLLKFSDECFWLSIADSDIELWAQAVAAMRNLSVSVSEPDVSPLAIQGPKALNVAIKLFGEQVRQLRYFGFFKTSLQDIPLVLARSGWSKQGGFEIYLCDRSKGHTLWNLVKIAGEEFGIGPGAPNDLERLESGLISYGADSRHLTHPVNPFELGLGKLVNLDCTDDFIGREALERIQQQGITRRRVGLFIDGPPVTASPHPLTIYRHEHKVGWLSEMAYSPRLAQNIGVGIIGNQVEDSAANLRLDLYGSTRRVTITALPFI